jgi:hypothetical protein
MGMRGRAILFGLAMAPGAVLMTAQSGGPAPQDAPGVRLRNVAEAAGLRFVHYYSSTPGKYFVDSAPGGVAVFDYNGDGRPDIFFTNGAETPSLRKTSPALANRLYRNDGGMRFTDVTDAAGVSGVGYAMGAAAADYDNDGHVDLFVAGVQRNQLLHNRGDGRFEDVTARSGISSADWAVAGGWFDYDADGRLDLLVVSYVQWSPATNRSCGDDARGIAIYCHPKSFPGLPNRLYRNRGDGTFENVTKSAGLFDTANKMLGVALIDYDNDGWLDVFGANDTQPNRLYRNKGDGTFMDVGVMAGVAFNEAGVARAGMGVDAADYDGSGRQSLIIGNFSNEMMALYSNDGKGLFIDEAPASTIGRASLLRLTFACFFVDVDLDGLLDVFGANGHVADDIARVQPTITYAQPPHLFRNLGGKKFDDLSTRLGADFSKAVVARGAAYGDYDNDGDADLLITANNGPARLLRNEGAVNHSLRVTLAGTSSNRDAIGSKVRVRRDQGEPLSRMVKTGSSYLSQSELPLTFGLGTATKVTAIEITWPDGKVERVAGIDADQTVTIQEGKGVIRTAPFKAAAR